MICFLAADFHCTVTTSLLEKRLDFVLLFPSRCEIKSPCYTWWNFVLKRVKASRGGSEVVDAGIGKERQGDRWGQ